MDKKQLEYLINYHQDIAEQCHVHRRTSEQTLEELTVQALKELQKKQEE